MSELVHALSGASGATVSLLLTYPLTTIATKSQVKSDLSSPTQKRIVKIIRSIIIRDGYKGFFNGLESAIYGVALTNFIYYLFYEYISRFLLNNREVFKSPFKLTKLLKLSFKNKNVLSTMVGLTTVESILSGLISGCINVVLTNPIWVVNTRMTVSKSNKSFLHHLVSIIKKERISNLFNGLMPSLILVLNPIIQYTIYEQFKNFLI
ncbi:mitochondrial carrier, partial [Ascoidea rubescens DSM 1968]